MNNKSERWRALRTEMWKSFRAPLGCAVAMFVAALLLINLQTQKAAFDKRQNATLLLVTENENARPSDDVRRIYIEKLAAAVRPQRQTGTGAVEADRDAAAGPDPMRVVARSAEEASTQGYKSPVELFAKLAENIIRQKNEDTRFYQARVDTARARQEELQVQKLAARADLNKYVEESELGTLDIQRLAPKIDAASPLRMALAKIYPNGGTRLIPDAVAADVDRYFSEEMNKATTIETTSLEHITATGVAYQKILRDVYHQVTDPQKFRAIAETAPEKTMLSVVLDDKLGLGTVYWLVRVALSGIVVFAFLYLIFIPLKHLFFWTTSGEILTDHAKKLLERRDAVSATTPVARAAIVALTAGTIGTVAIAASNGLPFQKTAQLSTAAETTQGPGRGPRGTDPLRPQAKDPSDTSDEELLKEYIVQLTNEVNGLKGELARLEPSRSETIYLTDPEISGAVSSINRLSSALGYPGLNSPNTLFGNLGLVRSSQSDLDTKLDGRFGRLDRLIGEPARPGLSLPSTSPFPDDSVFTRLSGLSRTLGTLRNDPQPDMPVVDSLRHLTEKLGTQGSTDPSTLFGKTNSTLESVNKLTDVAASIRREQLGTTGGNFFTLAKTLVSSQRHRVSAAAVAEIERLLAGREPELRTKLNSLIGDRVYSEGELRKELRLPEKVWDQWKSTILRLTRVARY